MSTVNKAELVERVSEQAGISKAAAQQALDALTGTITDVLTEEGSVVITGFGSFSITQRSARKGRNPSTGAEIDIPASKSAKFKPGKALKDAVNGKN